MGKGKIRLHTGGLPPGEWALGLHVQIPLQRVAWALNQIPGIHISLFNSIHTSYELADQFVMMHDEELLLLLAETSWLQRKKSIRDLQKTPLNAMLLCPDKDSLPVSVEQIRSHLMSVSGITLVASFENPSVILKSVFA